MNGFAQAILKSNLEDVLHELLFERVPFVFNSQWEPYRAWRQTLGHAINVDPCEIVIIGSAAVGFSLSPVKQLKSFDKDSDIDVGVISDHFFSEAWHHLRAVDLTLDNLTPPQRAAVIEHQKRYVYWGCIATDKILPILPFASSWLAARSFLAGIEPTVERIINFRVYKDFRALRSYQMRGLTNLRNALLDPEGDFNAKLS